MLKGVVWSGVDCCGVVCYFCDLVWSALDLYYCLTTSVGLFIYLGPWI